MSDESVVAFIREEVPDWDDEVKATARFKAFSGQRSDWEPQFRFWRDLIIKIARRFHLLTISPSQMKNSWFNRGGLRPLCLNDVLLEMYKAGDLLQMKDLGDPTSGRLSEVLKKMINFAGALRSSTSTDVLDDHLILLVMLEEEAADVIKALSETHWTSSCIITMKKFKSLCREHSEAYALLRYLSRHGKAKYLSIKEHELIEGVKLSLSDAAVSSISSLDSDVLQLVWTVEEFQQQLDVIDAEYERSRKSALVALKSGNKNVALRYARKLKSASQSREKISSFLNRVEGVLHVIIDTESTKKVSEAIQSGARAIKENKINVEEVQMCLQELDELINSQGEVHKALELIPNVGDEEEEEEELKEMESEIEYETWLASTQSSKAADVAAASSSSSSVAGDSLCDAISHLKLEEHAPRIPMNLEDA